MIILFRYLPILLQYYHIVYVFFNTIAILLYSFGIFQYFINTIVYVVVILTSVDIVFLLFGPLSPHQLVEETIDIIV
jgi:hypothetical protein